MSRMPPPIVNPADLPVSEQIGYYRRELRRITPPTSFREHVLINVYQCLLEQCEARLRPAEPEPWTHPSVAAAHPT